MRTLQIIPSLIKGAAERIVLVMCNQLIKKENTTVKLITFRGDNSIFLINE